MPGKWDVKRKLNGKAYWREYSRKRYRERHPESRRNDPGSPVAVLGRTKRAEFIPDDVIADRERRRSYVPTLSQANFGDPAPGQSALDQLRKR